MSAHWIREREARWSVVAIFAAATVAIASCHDASGPAGVRTNQIPSLLLSAPVSASARRVRGTQPAAASGGALVVYVSLSPGTVPDGLSATISDPSMRDSVVTQVIDGGFDPVALPANIGDTIEVIIGRGPSVPPVTGFAVVTASRAPHVVRTSPPKGRTDVPLNVSIVVVFSAPVDSATIDTSTLSLRLGARPVAGVARISDTTGLRAEYVPDRRLADSTAYAIEVTRGVRDVTGVALDSAVSATFTTGGTLLSGGSLQIYISLPSDGTRAQVGVQGPLPAGGFHQTIAASQLITGLAPGQYAVTASSATNDSVGYLPEPMSDTVTVTNGNTSVAAVTYAQARLMDVIISGLPAGLHTYVGVYLQTPHNFVTAYGGGNGSYEFPVFPGPYDIEMPTTMSYADSSVYGVLPYYIEQTVSPGLSIDTVRLNYGKLTGTLWVNVTGLPAGASPIATVFGPFGDLPQMITQSGTTFLGTVAIGSYAACGAPVTVGSTTYVAIDSVYGCNSQQIYLTPGKADTVWLGYYVP